MNSNVLHKKSIDVSVVLPCLNEEKAIGICIKKIKEVFAKENIMGEIIVVDNGSRDSSAKIAEDLGAKVVVELVKGYGAAYLKGFESAGGQFIIMGDSDNTYDFGDIPVFLQKIGEGYEFVIGSRFKGKIQKNAMPWLNRYIGNPILSGMCRLFFRTRLSDIHCGMRAFTREAYYKMKLVTLGMEFATEMVVSALQNKLKICEIPVNYYPREGESKLNRFYDAWRHIRFMLLYCPLWLYFIPGMTGFVVSFFSLIFLSRGPFTFFGRQWDVHFMFFAGIVCILSYQILNLGVYAHTYALSQGFLKADKITVFFQKRFSLEKGLFAGGIIVLAGIGIDIFIFVEWLIKHFGTLSRIRESILAMTLLVIGIQTMFSSFFISLLFLKRKV